MSRNLKDLVGSNRCATNGCPAKPLRLSRPGYARAAVAVPGL
jgi:hypothetical protein